MSSSSKLLKPRKGSLKPLIYSQQVRSTCDKLGSWSASENGQGSRGQTRGTKPLTCGISGYLRVDSFGIELNSRTPCWRQSAACLMWETLDPPNTHWNSSPKVAFSLQNQVNAINQGFLVLFFVFWDSLQHITDHSNLRKKEVGGMERRRRAKRKEDRGKEGGNGVGGRRRRSRENLKDPQSLNSYPTALHPIEVAHVTPNQILCLWWVLSYQPRSTELSGYFPLELINSWCSKSSWIAKSTISLKSGFQEKINHLNNTK